MKRWREEQGQAMVMGVAILLLFLILMGVVDVARLYLARRRAQAAVSAAALAASQAAAQATANKQDPQSAAVQAADTVLADDGYPQGRAQVTMGRYQTEVHVLLGQQVSTLFLGLVGIRSLPVQVEETAIDQPLASSNNCAVLALGQNADYAFSDTQSGFGSLITVNGNLCAGGGTLDPIQFTGSPLTGNGQSVVVNGAVLLPGSGQNLGNLLSATLGIQLNLPILDPLTGMTPPAVPQQQGECTTSNHGNTITCTPGLYGTFNRLPSLVTSNQTLVFEPGLYYVQDTLVDISVVGDGKVQGNGVLFFLNGQGFQINGYAGDVQLSAPTQANAVYFGSPANLLIWATGSPLANISISNSGPPLVSSTMVNGTIYDPQGTVSILNEYDSATHIVNGQVIANVVQAGGVGPVTFGSNTSGQAQVTTAGSGVSSSGPYLCGRAHCGQSD